MLEQWHLRRDNILREQSFDSKSVRSTYTHKSIRSAYLSLMRHVISLGYELSMTSLTLAYQMQTMVWRVYYLCDLGASNLE